MPSPKKSRRGRKPSIGRVSLVSRPRARNAPAIPSNVRDFPVSRRKIDAAGRLGPDPPRRLSLDLVMTPHQHILGFVDTSRQIRRPPVIGMQFLHQRPVRTNQRPPPTRPSEVPKLHTPHLRSSCRGGGACFGAPCHAGPALPHAIRQTGGRDRLPSAARPRDRPGNRCHRGLRIAASSSSPMTCLRPARQGPFPASCRCHDRAPSRSWPISHRKLSVLPGPRADLNIRKNDPLRIPSNQTPSPPRPIAMSMRPRNNEENRREKRRTAAASPDDKRERRGVRLRERPQRAQHEKEQDNSKKKINHSSPPVWRICDKRWSAATAPRARASNSSAGRPPAA